MSSKLSFENFNLNRQLLDAVKDLGYETPTEIQAKCLPLISGGQEVIGIAQTGTGKTAAYLLPVLMKIKYAKGIAPRALILGPTKELVMQLQEHAVALAKYTDLRIMALYGGVGPKVQIEALQKGVDIIVATPGRFMELYRKQEVSTKLINTLVLDEADRMMEMGFMSQLRKMLEILPVKRQNLLFSATFPDKVEQLSAEFLEFPVRVEVTPQATPAKQVTQMLYQVPNLRTKINLLELLLRDEAFNRVMIFARSKDNANNIFSFLERKKIGPARVIHSNKGQNSRINAINEFKNGDLRILVSTDVTSRGIDVVKVSHVINFDVPILYEDYVHRIGRTGRAYEDGIAITFATDIEMYHIAKIEKLIREPIPVKALPETLEVTETPFTERQEMLRERDLQKRRDDPDFKGAFHERVEKKAAKKKADKKKSDPVIDKKIQKKIDKKIDKKKAKQFLKNSSSKKGS